MGLFSSSKTTTVNSTSVSTNTDVDVQVTNAPEIRNEIDFSQLGGPLRELAQAWQASGKAQAEVALASAKMQADEAAFFHRALLAIAIGGAWWFIRRRHAR